MEGFILGLHRSPFRGSSVEFSEHRQYSPGDEIKHIDWRVYAKIDRYYIKQYEAETNLACNIFVDASASMGYKSDPGALTKLQYASCLAACLAYFMIGQRDAAGLAIFDDKVRTVLPPRLSQTHIRHILSGLDAPSRAARPTSPGRMHDLADGLKRRGLMVLISDLLDDVEAIKSALQQFRFRGPRRHRLPRHGRRRADVPLHAMTQFEDLETGATTLVSPESTRTTYLRELRQFLTAVEKGCADVKADYKLFNTKTPLEVALSEYLYRRSQLG